MAAPAFGAAGTLLTATTAASAAVAVPAGVTADQVILVHLYKESTAAVTPPAGFTEVGTPITATNITQHVFWKRATGADSGTYTFTWTGSTWREAIAVRYTGVALAGDPVDVFNRAARSTSGTVTPAVSVTTLGIERLLVWSGTNVNSGTWTAPSGYTLRTSGTTWQSVATVAQNAQGSSGSVTGTCSSSAEETAWLLALRPLDLSRPSYLEQSGSRPRWAPRPRRGQFLRLPLATADPNLPLVADGGAATDTFTVDEQLTVADTGTAVDTFTPFDNVPVPTTETGTGTDSVTFVDISASTLLPLRAGPSYEAVVVARIPSIGGPPTLRIVDDIQWKAIDWTQELSTPQTATVTCGLSTLTEDVKQRLRTAAAAFATEVWIVRGGQIVCAGPLTSVRRDGEVVTFTSAGLLAYLARWQVYADLVFSQVDQFAIVKALIDHWQSRPYGNVGIDATAASTSGVLRDATYLKTEQHRVLQRVQEMGKRANGFDIDVDPASRQLQLWFPTRGVDRSTGEDSIVFDSGNIVNPSTQLSLGSDDVATVAFGTGTSSDAGTLFSTTVNAELQAQVGAFATSSTWDSVSEQPTLDGHVAGLLAARGDALFVPGPDVRVTPDADISAYDAGDTVRYELDDQLGIAGNFRLRSLKVSVSSSGAETVSPTFV